MTAFEKQQKIADEAIIKAMAEVNKLRKIVQLADIPHHKNWGLEWSFDNLANARFRLIGLDASQYASVKDIPV